MQTENLALNYSGHAQVVEYFCLKFPWLCITILLQVLIVESIHLRGGPRLVIAPQNRNVPGVLQLEAHQILECLN